MVLQQSTNNDDNGDGNDGNKLNNEMLVVVEVGNGCIEPYYTVLPNFFYVLKFSKCKVYFKYVAGD